MTKLRPQEKIILAVAFSSIAATLLDAAGNEDHLDAVPATNLVLVIPEPSIPFAPPPKTVTEATRRSHGLNNGSELYCEQSTSIRIYKSQTWIEVQQTDFLHNAIQRYQNLIDSPLSIHTTYIALPPFTNRFGVDLV